METYADAYTKWLKEEINQEQISDNLTSLVLPILNRHNDYIEIYVEKHSDGTYILSDYGETINDLEISGIDINGSDKRRDIVKTTLRRFGTQLDKNALKSKANSKDELPIAKQALIQSILSIDDLFYLSRDNVATVFKEEVENFFDKNKIYYSKRPKFNGKSEYIQSFDFLLQRNQDNPERVIQVNNQITRQQVESIVFKWLDCQEDRDDDTTLYVIINDKPSKSAVNTFCTYGISTIYWEEIESKLEKLA